MDSDPGFQRHRLIVDHFTAFAAGDAGAEAIDALLAAERSHRMLMLYALLRSARERPGATGRLPSVDHAWTLLVRSHQQAPEAVESLLLTPQVGRWCAHVLRRLHGAAPATPAPLWAEVGYLHALAAAAATLAGLDFHMSIPVYGELAVLPSLGGASMPPRGKTLWGIARARRAAGPTTVRVDAHVVELPPNPRDDAPGWQSVRRLRAQARARSIDIAFDDLDPYRALQVPTLAQRCPPAAVDRWRELFDEAWSLLNEEQPAAAETLARGLKEIVPVYQGERFRVYSASGADAFGSALASQPGTASELAVTLIHEFQHIKLNGLQRLVDLCDGDAGPEPLYAPWRDDPRPAKGLLQGVYAFSGVTCFWRERRTRLSGPEADLAQYEFALWRRQTLSALRILQERPELTDYGRHLVDTLSQRLASWQTEPVPANVLSAAEAAAVDHRISWRLWHLRPDRELVAELARAWSRGQAVPLPLTSVEQSRVVSDPRAQWLDTRAVLARLQLVDPVEFRRLRADPNPGQQVSGAVPADLDYVSGDLEEAGERYEAALVERPDSPPHLAGLAMCLHGTGDSDHILLHRPELVRAVRQAILSEAGKTPSVRELALWLGPALRPDAG
ncbi:HEXXH motif domain-containing protein [Wenjunlia tyrosinilytica]|uniref:HEXXH motif domain-containing protein n=1 Tax=Wenjunlia tyrosinilytica TaxID=1544741 RepID=UPI0016653934|nr:HEXXH motif domain-containing protein [Wenjunlia tyrosinilytica]